MAMIKEDRYWVEMTHEPLHLHALNEFCESEHAGAIAFFIGTVRNHFDGKPVTAIDYHGYPEMAEKVLLKIVQDVFSRWPVHRAAVVHRLGLLHLKEASVAIAVSSPHREEAFAACRYIIEEIKKDLPVWKKEHFANGTAGWKEDTAGHRKIP